MFERKGRFLALVAVLLTAAVCNAQSHSAMLTWTPVAGASGYTPMRGTVSGGPYAPLVQTLDANANYTDTTVAAGQTYYYVVTDTNATGGAVSANSAEVVAVIPGAVVPPPPTSSVRFRAVASGNFTDSAGNSWEPNICTGGTYITTTHAITGTPDAGLYQPEYYGKTLTCNVTGLMPSMPSLVTLKLAETYWAAVGKRVFSVTANGTAIFTNLDIIKDAGAEYKADDKTATVTTDAAGAIKFSFTTTTDNAKYDAISIIQTTAPPPPPPAPMVTGLTCAATYTNIPSGATGTCTLAIDGVTATSSVTAP